ncbi:transposase [Proteiniclasticum sp. QWL-01]|uniref:transposase n=1 Tax=Proteiniclasticum sp. QWL-01 TaxID=3036945 RepID=UPI00241154E0|nr:transposase [Proteiniclasticum sp. QWL-01]WFF73185.1 transposase [Proteiniclasticum sp. QWL-01]WFF74320.1 transposase [Proteiniclasticum sp. QWL-01]
MRLLKRCLGYFDSPAMNKPISPKTMDALKTLSLIHDQQFEMWKLKINRIERRIVSVSQPWVRPIKRGKASVNTEFGSKIALSTVDGYVRMEYFSFENFNEALTLQESAERYKERTGSYPERILADKIYRNKANLAFCKSKNIRMNGPALGRPPKDPQVRQQQRAAEVQEAGDRNMVEAKIGESKRKYGLDRIMERTQQATEVMICVSFVVMNSFRNLRKHLASFFDKNQVFNFYISFEVYAIAS